MIPLQEPAAVRADRPTVVGWSEAPVQPWSRVQMVSAVGFLAATSFVVQNFGVKVVPSAPYLTYEASDVMALVATFTMGPWTGLLVVLIRNLLRMLLVHPDAVGLAMNSLASGTFAVVSGISYRAWHTRTGAIAALLAGIVAQTVVMAGASLAVLPIYLGLPLSSITGSILTVIIPFNLAKGTVNSILTYALYKRVSGYFPRSSS